MQHLEGRCQGDVLLVRNSCTILCIDEKVLFMFGVCIECLLLHMNAMVDSVARWDVNATIR